MSLYMHSNTNQILLLPVAHMSRNTGMVGGGGGKDIATSFVQK